ncbi:MAG: sulfite exporter TauE/SafE family protein [Rhodocyclaceae bacterium]
MPETGYLAVFLIGLLGGVHCIGMCGGVVGALSMPMPGQARLRTWPVHLAYNLGRVASYTLIGTLVGAIGSATLLFNRWLPVQMALYVLANVMLLALGLYLTGFTKVLSPVERLGHHLWARVQPVSSRFLPARSWRRALPLGLVWGLLPCGLTYSILSTALVSGSGMRGGALMLAFGLGTLPNLFLAGVLLAKFRDFTRRTAVRMFSGAVVIGFALFGLFHAPQLGGQLWEGVIC